MVHLFSMQRRGRVYAVLAKRENGSVVIESINGFDPSQFSPSIVKLAHGRVSKTSTENHVAASQPTYNNHIDDDYDLRF